MDAAALGQSEEAGYGFASNPPTGYLRAFRITLST
jgi:hypothetical protein